MVTIRLLGAESNGINNYCVDEPDYNGPLDLNHTSQFSENAQGSPGTAKRRFFTDWF
jgi:hypothetical protein